MFEIYFSVEQKSFNSAKPNNTLTRQKTKASSVRRPAIIGVND